MRGSGVQVPPAAPSQTKPPGAKPGGLFLAHAVLAAIAHQAQERHEQVDEVKVKPQRAHDGGFLVGLCAVRFGIHFFEHLRAKGRQTREDNHGNHRQHKAHRRGFKKDVQSNFE